MGESVWVCGFAFTKSGCVGLDLTESVREFPSLCKLDKNRGMRLLLGQL